MDDDCSADSEHLTDELAAAVSSLEMKSREIPQKDGPPIVEKQLKVRTWSKTRALHDLADHFGMLRGRGHVGTLEDVMRALASLLLPQTTLIGSQSLARENGTPATPAEDSTPETSTLV